ncbi:aminopeptidase B-like [Branchiostoma floridae]|uniref:Aminopeptidase B-like n=1 Tax=Branchiostoma floridae TaxID=7739 RepID=A0A9J7KW15_BRAFL|nr:aminopeptidase B-like [Branchiostoma floridae]
MSSLHLFCVLEEGIVFDRWICSVQNAEVVPDISDVPDIPLPGQTCGETQADPRHHTGTGQEIPQDCRVSHCAELTMRWCMLIIKSNFTSDLPKVRAFLESQGKKKYTLPIYRALKAGSPEAQDFAREVFEAIKDTLHVNVRNYVQKILSA